MNVVNTPMASCIICFLHSSSIITVSLLQNKTKQRSTNKSTQMEAIITKEQYITTDYWIILHIH